MVAPIRRKIPGQMEARRLDLAGGVGALSGAGKLASVVTGEGLDGLFDLLASASAGSLAGMAVSGAAVGATSAGGSAGVARLSTVGAASAGNSAGMAVSAAVVGAASTGGAA